MKIMVEGKAHLEGHSKRTGRDYNFNQVHYLGKSFGVEGLAAKTLMLDPKAYPIDDIMVGGTYEVEFDDRGGVVNFELC